MAAIQPWPDEEVLKHAFADVGLLQSVVDEVDDGVYFVDRERRIVYWNRGAENIAGYLAQDVEGRFCHNDMLMHCDSEGKGLCGEGCPLAEVMKDGKPRSIVVFLRHRQGHRLPVRVRAHAIHDSRGEIVGALELFEKAPPSRGEPAAPESLGSLYESTGAATREYGEMKLDHALAVMKRFGAPAGWIAIELDHVAELEHRYGHGFIEAAMKIAAQSLDANVGAHDVLTHWDRIGFRVLAQDTSQGQLAKLAQKLAVMVEASNVEWWGDPLSVTASESAVLADETDTVESLERRARQLLQQRRALPRNQPEKDTAVNQLRTL